LLKEEDLGGNSIDIKWCYVLGVFSCIFFLLHLIQRLINNKTYEKKNKVFRSFLEMDRIGICLFVEHQVVLESRKEG
jgi:hypothetical protein